VLALGGRLALVRRDGAIVAWHEVPSEAPPKEPSRRVRSNSCRCAPILELAAPDHTVPYGTVPSMDAFPGTSCQATIVLSLRDALSDISQQALARPDHNRTLWDEIILRAEALIKLALGQSDDHRGVDLYLAFAMNRAASIRKPPP
jgi:hypothetical protein